MKKYYHAIIILIIALTVVSGCGRNNAAKNEPADNSIKTGSTTSEGVVATGTEISEVNATTSEEIEIIVPSKKIFGKNSQEIMEKMIKERLGIDPENYKIFQEIENPYNKNIKALAFAPDYLKTKECCQHVTTILINNNGVLEEDYIHLTGALNQMLLENIKWLNKDKLTYDFHILGEGGDFIQQQFLQINYFDTITGKDSQEIMEKIRKNTDAKSLKIFYEINSPDSSRTAVLFGFTHNKKPTDIFVKKNERLENHYEVVRINPMISDPEKIYNYLDNVKWLNEDELIFENIFSETNTKTAKKTLKMILK